MKNPPMDFLKEEIRCDFLVSTLMKKVWNIQIELVQQLLTICEKYGFKCWADSGTLIGAVRNSGFIPWDDDIDMVMLRDDFDKFVEIIEEELEAPYFFESIKTDRHCKFKTAKLMKSGTAAISDSQSKGKQCIFIDIFVYDAMPTKLKEINKHLNKIKVTKEICNASSKLSRLMPDWLYKKFPLKLMYNNRFERLLRKYSIADTFYVALPSLTYKTPIRRKILYEKTIYMDFEYIKLPIPVGYDEILRLEYGDYMIPCKAPSMHGELYFDTERDESIVKKELRKHCK